MKRMYAVAIISGIILAGACSILKKEDPEKAVRDFLIVFQNSLSKNEMDVLKQFQTAQSSRTVLAIINILQNKGEAIIDCQPSFQNAMIVRENESFKVEIPVTFRFKEKPSPYASTTLTFWLKPFKDKLVISRMK